jgi:hypothetical protein
VSKTARIRLLSTKLHWKCFQPRVLSAPALRSWSDFRAVHSAVFGSAASCSVSWSSIAFGSFVAFFFFVAGGFTVRPALLRFLGTFAASGPFELAGFAIGAVTSVLLSSGPPVIFLPSSSSKACLCAILERRSSLDNWSVSFRHEKDLGHAYTCEAGRMLPDFAAFLHAADQSTSTCFIIRSRNSAWPSSDIVLIRPKSSLTENSGGSILG